jgi:hypothetical protein
MTFAAQMGQLARAVWGNIVQIRLPPWLQPPGKHDSFGDVGGDMKPQRDIDGGRSATESALRQRLAGRGTRAGWENHEHELKAARGTHRRSSP